MQRTNTKVTTPQQWQEQGSVKADTGLMGPPLNLLHMLHSARCSWEFNQSSKPHNPLFFDLLLLWRHNGSHSLVACCGCGNLGCGLVSRQLGPRSGCIPAGCRHLRPRLLREGSASGLQPGFAASTTPVLGWWCCCMLLLLARLRAGPCLRLCCRACSCDALADLRSSQHTNMLAFTMRLFGVRAVPSDCWSCSRAGCAFSAPSGCQSSAGSGVQLTCRSRQIQQVAEAPPSAVVPAAVR